MIIVSTLDTKSLFNKLEALELAWDSLGALAAERPKHLHDINSALVLSADRVELVYNDIHNINTSYIKPMPAKEAGVTKDYWLQRAIELADELGEAVPALFQEVEQRQEMSPWLAEALAECYVLAGMASAALVAYEMGDGAAACGNRLKNKLGSINKETLGLVEAAIDFAKERSSHA